MNSWIENIQAEIIEKLSYPAFRKYGILYAYNRLKNREYKKITGKELKNLYDFHKVKKKEDIEQEE
jgi:hypothetical protein